MLQLFFIKYFSCKLGHCSRKRSFTSEEFPNGYFFIHTANIQNEIQFMHS